MFTKVLLVIAACIAVSSCESKFNFETRNNRKIILIVFFVIKTVSVLIVDEIVIIRIWNNTRHNKN